MPNETDLVAVSEVAALLGKSVRTVHRMIQAGELKPVMKIGGGTGAYLFQRAEIEAAIEQRAAAS